MSWLPSGLSSLTGQITSFTKEVLSEGAEEIDDHVTELRVARSQIKELELLCSTQRSELDRIKFLIDELTVQLQSKELQMQSNASEYRTAAELKEKEIKELKRQHAELCEKYSNSSYLYSDQPERNSANSNNQYIKRSRDFEEGIDDFHDVISSQHEINHLRNEVRRLEAELDHWRRSSGVQPKPENEISSSGGGLENLRLQSEVNDLKQQLANEVDRHQHELSALQDSHRRTVSALKKSHKTALDQLQQQQQQAAEEMQNVSVSGEDTNQRLQLLEQQNRKLVDELELSRASDRKKTQELDELHSKLYSANTEIKRLNEEKQASQLKIEGLTRELQASSNKRTELLDEIDHCKFRIQQQEQEMNQMHSSRMLDAQTVSSGFLSSTPVAPSRVRARSCDLKASFIDDSMSFEELNARNQYLDEQVKTLQSQIEKHEQELEQFELVKSDWQMEKQALEGVLKKLREELRDKEGELSIIQARKGEGHCVRCDPKEQSLSGKERQEDLLLELEKERKNLKALEMEFKNHTDASSRKCSELEAELQKKNNDYTSVWRELNARDLQINELTAQLEQAKTKLKTTEDQNSESESSQEKESELLKNQLEHLQTEIVRLTRERDDLQEGSRQELEVLRTEKQTLEESLEELDASHQEAVNQIVKSRADVIRSNESLKQQIVNLEQRLIEKERQEEGEKENSARIESENVTLKKELSENAVKLRELQRVADEFERTTVSQKTQINELREEENRLAELNQKLLGRLQDLERDGSLASSEFHSVLEEQVEQLRRELESSKLNTTILTDELGSVRKYLGEKEKKTELLESQIQTLKSENAPQKSDESAALEVLELRARCADLEEQLGQNAASLQKAETLHESQAGEIGRLKEEAKKLTETSDELESVAKLYEAEVERLTTVEEEHQVLSTRYAELEGEMEKWKKLATQARTDVATQENKSAVETDEQGERYERLVNDLQTKILTLESEVSTLKETNEMKRVVEGSELSHGDVNGRVLTSNRTSEENLQSNQITENQMNALTSSTENVVHLKKTVSQQEDIIKTLNSKYSSILRLLEDRSMAAHGSTVLADMHRLESEVHVLRNEKEHILSVLNEKTREASSLKSEVHRLMSVVSAGKAALTKLQQDSQDMARNQEMSNMDMKKEAIKKLSQLVKDRDIEIEALKDKNTTLLQVLQSSSSDGSTHHISQLIQERDDLQRQITAYQNDREQLINTLNVKHQESVNYYAEVERLGAEVVDLTEQKEKYERNISNLSSQYEEKQKSLVKALNELSLCKQKLADAERRFSSLQGRLGNEGGNLEIDAPQQSSSLLSSDSDIPDVRLMKQGFEMAVAEKDAKIAELGRRLDELEQVLRAKEQLVNAREKEMSVLSAKLHLAEANVSAKESELNGLRKQCENLTFQMQGLTDERSELTNETDALRKRCESLVAETQSIRQSNSAMTINLSNKDLEISTLQEKVRSLENVVHQKQGDDATDGGHAEMEHLQREIEMLRNQGHLLMQDRDHLYVAIHQFQAENVELKNELGRTSEKEQRLTKECERLRGHLLVIEEGHTREAIEAEEREKDLRNRLAAVEEKAFSSSAAVVSVRSDASRQVENLQIQLHAIAEQRDNALLQLANAQETITSYASSLTNLQMVLEQFQAERYRETAVEVELYKKALDNDRAENQRLRLELDGIQRQLEETLEALAAAERLSEQLDKKENAIAALREEVVLRENELTKVEAELRKLNSSTEAKVDKVIVKNLFIGYFHAPTSKRSEAFQVIGQILNFTKDELEEITRSSGSDGWISGFFRRKPTASQKSSPSQTQGFNQSFSELFVKFLERESTPQPEVRLPAELMAQEQQERRHQHHQQQQRLPAFNPFSAPVDSSMPLTLPSLADVSRQSPLLSGANTSSNLLIGSLGSQTMPIFAPAMARADTPVQGRDSSAGSSGRSTPSGSGAILRDILQQR